MQYNCHCLLDKALSNEALKLKNPKVRETAYNTLVLP